MVLHLVYSEGDLFQEVHQVHLEGDLYLVLHQVHHHVAFVEAFLLEVEVHLDLSS